MCHCCRSIVKPQGGRTSWQQPSKGMSAFSGNTSSLARRGSKPLPLQDPWPPKYPIEQLPELGPLQQSEWLGATQQDPWVDEWEEPGLRGDSPHLCISQYHLTTWIICVLDAISQTPPPPSSLVSAPLSHMPPHTRLFFTLACTCMCTVHDQDALLSLPI